MVLDYAQFLHTCRSPAQLYSITIGEIGALKKEIVFTGDVLNTTARIPSLCKELQSGLLISGAIIDLLPHANYQYSAKGEVELKGRNKKEELFSVTLEKKPTIANTM